MVPVENRKANTFTHLVLQHVRPGTIIHTDLWKGYNYLEASRHEHLTVNHSLYFKYPVIGIHTNTIEATWNALKAQIKPRSRTKNDSEDYRFKFI